MLLKVYLEDTLPFLTGPLAGKANSIVLWIVQENVPMNHPSQLDALVKAFGAAVSSDIWNDVDLTTVMLMRGEELVDLGQTPTQARLISGSTVHLIARNNTPRALRQGPGSFRSVADDNSDAGSAIGSPRGGASSMFESSSMGGAPDDEDYVAAECGWFPFRLESNYGQQPVARYIDPSRPVTDADPTLPMQDLCERCARTVSQVEALTIPVDRHYRPMALNFDVAEGWVEKLSLNRFARWQKRYLMVSDKSVDWFETQPKPTQKVSIKGTRSVARDGVANLIDIIENPDPHQYPKCKDTSFFHFGLVFKEPATTLFIRVPSIQQRTKYVTFLKKSLTRLADRTTQRDPVFWKKWADAFLTNLADLGELSVSTTNEAAELNEELVNLRAKRAVLRDERPGLEAVVEERRQRVRELRAEQQRIAEAQRALDREAQQVEDAVTVDELGLTELEASIRDELRKAEVLRDFAVGEDASSRARIAQLEADIATARAHHKEIFARWRRHEEHHRKQSLLIETTGGDSGALSGRRHIGALNELSFSVDGSPLPMSVRELPNGLRAALSASVDRCRQQLFATPAAARTPRLLQHAGKTSPEAAARRQAIAAKSASATPTPRRTNKGGAATTDTITTAADAPAGGSSAAEEANTAPNGATAAAPATAEAGRAPSATVLPPAAAVVSPAAGADSAMAPPTPARQILAGNESP